MEAAEPWNRGSLGMRARGLFASVCDHSLFSRCFKQGRSERWGCRSPKDGCGVGDRVTARETFSWLSVWM